MRKLAVVLPNEWGDLLVNVNDDVRDLRFLQPVEDKTLWNRHLYASTLQSKTVIMSYETDLTLYEDYELIFIRDVEGVTTSTTAVARVKIAQSTLDSFILQLPEWKGNLIKLGGLLRVRSGELVSVQ